MNATPSDLAHVALAAGKLAPTQPLMHYSLDDGKTWRPFLPPLRLSHGASIRCTDGDSFRWTVP